MAERRGNATSPTTAEPDRPPRRRASLAGLAIVGLLIVTPRGGVANAADAAVVPKPSNLSRTFAEPDPKTAESLRQRWERHIMTEARARYCDSQMGEEIGWLMSPVLRGFYNGYVLTKDPIWIDRLVDWTDAWIKRGVVEPDGYMGWPKVGASGTDTDGLDRYDADSLVGEAMALRPVLQMASVIRKDPTLKARYGGKSDAYVKLARSIFDKWDARGAWRVAGAGDMTVVLPFGIDSKTGTWTAGYKDRAAPGQGFSHPDNKANLVASWLLALYDATGNEQVKERGAAWFRLMKSRMSEGSGGTYRIWNYWQPAGPWDYRSTGAPKSWIGIHPNAGYYMIDVDAIVDAYEHGIVFTADDMKRLIETAHTESRPWPALAPYDAAIQRQVEASLDPDAWAGLDLVPWYLGQKARQPE